MQVPADLRYSTDHEWVRLSGSVATIGITDYAQNALGDVVYVEVPTVGTKVGSGDRFGEVESTKSVSDVYAPLSGVVIRVNDVVTSSPELLNSDPYGEGWLCDIELDNVAQVGTLLDAVSYSALVAG